MAPPGEMCTSPSVARTRSLSWASAAGSAAPFTSTAAPWSCYGSSSSAHGHTVLLGTSSSGNTNRTWYLDKNQRSFLDKRLVIALSAWLGLSYSHCLCPRLCFSHLQSKMCFFGSKGCGSSFPGPSLWNVLQLLLG